MLAIPLPRAHGLRAMTLLVAHCRCALRSLGGLAGRLMSTLGFNKYVWEGGRGV